MSKRSELEQIGRNKAWEVIVGVHSTSFRRGPDFIHVRFTRTGSVLRVRVGATGGYDLTGSGKRERLIKILEGK